MAFHALIDRDEALQLEAHGLLAANMLGDGDAVVSHAKDVGALGTLAGKGHVVEGFHHDAQNPKQERCHGENSNNLCTCYKAEHLEAVAQHQVGDEAKG